MAWVSQSDVLPVAHPEPLVVATVLGLSVVVLLAPVGRVPQLLRVPLARMVRPPVVLVAVAVTVAAVVAAVVGPLLALRVQVEELLAIEAEAQVVEVEVAPAAHPRLAPSAESVAQAL